MNTLTLLRAVSESIDFQERAHHNNRLPLEYEDLEPRHLLSAALAGTATGAAGSLGNVALQPVGIGSVQPQLPFGSELANLSEVTSGVYGAGSPISAGSGLTELPISPLLTPTVTENETPLNNGTPITGTVWITPAPEPSGIFHFGTTLSPVFSHLYLQTVNPDGGPPSFTHFGENSDGTLNGVAIEEPIAVGPLGPSITIEIQAVQPPPVEAHQLFGPPAQLQQDQTTAPQNSRTPPGGVEGARPGPNQGVLIEPERAIMRRPTRRAAMARPRVVPPKTHHVPVAPPPLAPIPPPPIEEKPIAPVVPPPAGKQPTAPVVPPPAGKQPTTPGAAPPTGGQAAPGSRTPAGPAQAAPGASTPTPAGPAQRAPADPARRAPAAPKPNGQTQDSPAEDSKKSGAPSGNAFLHGPRLDGSTPAVELIDAAISSLASDSDDDADDITNDGHLSTLFGAAAFASGGLQIAFHDPSRLDRATTAGPPDGAFRSSPWHAHRSSKP